MCSCPHSCERIFAPELCRSERSRTDILSDSGWNERARRSWHYRSAFCCWRLTFVTTPAWAYVKPITDIPTRLNHPLAECFRLRVYFLYFLYRLRRVSYLQFLCSESRRKTWRRVWRDGVAELLASVNCIYECACLFHFIYLINVASSEGWTAGEFRSRDNGYLC